MAMRPRGGRANPNRPPRLIVGRVYEQFKPMSEWRQEDDYDTLLVYLPGFQKEYIKVTTEDLNIVRVRGERLIAGNKWSRFQEDYRVPENCEMRGIRAKFDGGILTITMPRKIVSPLPTTTTTTRVTPKPEEQPVRRTKQEEPLPKPKEEAKEKATSSKAALESEKKPEKPQMTPLEPIKQQPIKTIPEPKEANEEFMFGSLPTILPKKEEHKVDEKPNAGVKTNLDKGKGKQETLEEEMKRELESIKGKTNVAGVVDGGDKVEEMKKVVRRGVNMNMNEDRKLLVNVGVGILVIVALGVHVSYTIGLIGKGNK